MATPNAAVLTNDPATAVHQDPLVAAMLRALGGTNPAISQQLTEAATFGEDTSGLGLGPNQFVSARANPALRQLGFQQFLRGQQQGAQRDLRGVGSGPAAEQQSGIDAILNAFQRENIIRPNLRSRGGGGELPKFELPKQPEPPKFDPSKARPIVPPTPEPVKPPPQGLTRLQRALRKSEDFSRELNRRQQSLRRLPPQLGESPDALNRRLGGSAQQFQERFRGARTAEEAFFLDLTEQDPGSMEAMNTQDLARHIIQAWNKGGERTVKEGFKMLQQRTARLGSGRSKRAKTRQVLERQEKKNYRRLSEQFDASALLGVDGQKYGLSNEEVFRAFLTPSSAQDMLSQIQQGRDPQDIAREARGRRQIKQMQKQQERIQAQFDQANQG
jgi:hypothetical protein